MNFNTYLYEFVIYPNQSGQTSFNLADIPDLKDAAIFGLETYNVNDLGLSPQGNNVIGANVLATAYLRLYVEDASNERGVGTYVRNLPMINLHNIQNSSNDAFEHWPYDMPGKKVYWDKCELIFGAGIGNSENVAVLLNINYKFTTKA